jgi:hypothetical protein
MIAPPAMTRAALLAAVAALAASLSACPLPQPLAEVARTDGGVSTPVILPETAAPAETTVLVKPDCVPPAQFTLSATVQDFDTDEAVEARWFLNWRPDSAGLIADEFVPASLDANDPLRPIPPIAFQPTAFGAPPAVALHVVEVVVSNGFLGIDNGTQPFQRAATPPFQTHSFLWVFRYADPSDPAGRCQ